MNIRRILYVGYYDYPENEQPLHSFPAANAKIEYVISLLVRLNFSVQFISLCSPRLGFFWMGRFCRLTEKISVRYLPSFRFGNRYINFVNFYLKKILIFFYLLFYIKTDDQVLVYHSLAYSDVICLLRKFRKFELILQVEEIYQDQIDASAYKSHFENAIFRVADSFMFPTILLNRLLNFSDRPYIVLHGSYKVYTPAELFHTDGSVHVVYAGVFDPRKGVLEAIKSVRFLNGNFHLHVLGFGTFTEISDVEKLICEVGSETKTPISYHGLLTGSSYSNLLSNCHIGLSPQDVGAKFGDTSFPSKILSYMGHGLKVVAVRIPVVETSAVASNIVFMQGSEAQDIAAAISEAANSNFKDSRILIDELDRLALQEFSVFLHI